MFILGTKVHNITLSQAIKKAERFLHDGKQHYIATPNPEIVLRARRNRAYRDILNKADLSIPDGVGLLLASRVLYGRRAQLRMRVAGVDFMQALCAELFATGSALRILLIGGQKGVAGEVAAALGNAAPVLRFYTLENANSPHTDFLIREIIRPDCVFVGLGAPKQERWIHGNLSRYPTVKIAMGVGGAFDMISGRIPRAPLFFRRVGMEWFWRLTMQPRRARRIFNAAIIFPALILYSKFKKHQHKSVQIRINPRL